MAVASSSDYAKGSLLDSDQDWYHGQLTRAEAEQALTASGKDCFLIRESKGALVLSLLYNQQSCHIKIKYGLGWYKLDLDSVTERFAEVTELLSYYHHHIIGDKLKVILREACKKDSPNPSPWNSSVYAKACPSVSDKAWYHGELTRTEAEQTLHSACSDDCFLIRENEGCLFLSLLHHDKVHHININYGPGWYNLETTSAPSFTELDKLVSYYRDNIVSEDIKVMLGVTCESNTITEKLRTAQGIYSRGNPEGLSECAWYHGDVSNEKVTEKLHSMTMDAFLVHQADTNLILSTKTAHIVSHKKIHRNPEGYRLDERERQFSTIPEMIAHYKQFPIDDEVLGAECVKAFPELEVTESQHPSHKYDTLSADPAKYKWYHENVTEEQAYAIFKDMSGNCFLVRQSGGDKILSCRLNGWVHHKTIQKNHDGYHLKERETFFETIPDLVDYYQKFAVEEGGTHLLGTACDRKLSESTLSQGIDHDDRKQTDIIFKKESSTLKMNWRQCADILAPVSALQAVKIGKHVYVGGGMRRDEETINIFKYDPDDDTWTPLPSCPTYQHGLTTLDDELLAVGGQKGSQNLMASAVYTLKGFEWVEKLPPMPTRRCLVSTTTHNNRIIITAGGVISNKVTGNLMRTDAVEIYIKDQHWYATKRLPFTIDAASLGILNDTCYLIGGNGQGSTTVYSTISSLLENAEQADRTYSTPQCPVTWDQLEDNHPLLYTAVAQVDKNIFALGGCSKVAGIRHGTQFISTYDFVTDTWVECKGAELPVPLYRTTVINLDKDEVMCIGGQTKSQQFSAKVFIGRYSTGNT